MRKLIQLKLDVDIDPNINKYKIKDRNEKKLAELATNYELKNIASSLSIDVQPRKTRKASYKIISNEKDFEQLIKKLNTAKIFSFDTETTSLNYIDAELVGISFSTNAWLYIPATKTPP